MVLTSQNFESPDLWNRFTLHEEYNNFSRDSYGRFPFWASMERDIFRPSVSEYLIKQDLLKPEYPDGCEFGLCVTHDIDVVFSPPYKKIFNGLVAYTRGDKIKARRELFSFYDRKQPYYNFDEILTQEEKYGVKSTWFFQALCPGEPEFNYRLSELDGVFGQILDAGCEIGLHGGFDAPDDLDRLLLEKRRLERMLGKKAYGYRSHYLKFSVPNTWEILSKAGFSYDSTLGFAECAGFRSGMCHPYKPVNLHTGKEIDIIEFPLHVMDISLFQKYMRLNYNEAWNLVRQMIDKIYECHGIFVVNWHNTCYLKDSNEIMLFHKILDYCKEKKAWMNAPLFSYVS